MIATAAIGHADGGLLRFPVIALAHPKPSIDAFALDDDVDGDLYQSSVSEATTD
ncbi:hypothetical protein ACDY96_00390 [Rhizobium mongolense]|uniref:hypothetical protein n=2 Tax=Rhizobium TaxID=379 RepID=UPI003556703B